MNDDEKKFMESEKICVECGKVLNYDTYAGGTINKRGEVENYCVPCHNVLCNVSIAEYRKTKCSMIKFGTTPHLSC